MKHKKTDNTQYFMEMKSISFKKLCIIASQKNTDI